MKSLNSSKMLKTVVSFSLIVIVLIIFLVILKSCNGKAPRSVEPPKLSRTEEPPKLDVGKFSIRAKEWNQRVVDLGLPRSYVLPEAEPVLFVKKINGWLLAFSEPLPAAVERELEAESARSSYSFFSFYKEFRSKYRIAAQVSIDESMTSIQVREVLTKVTGEPEVNIKCVSIVAAMNNQCIYLDLFRKDLYERGMDRNITSCSSIYIDAGRSPAIDSWMRTQHKVE